MPDILARVAEDDRARRVDEAQEIDDGMLGLVAQ